MSDGEVVDIMRVLSKIVPSGGGLDAGKSMFYQKVLNEHVSKGKKCIFLDVENEIDEEDLKKWLQ